MEGLLLVDKAAGSTSFDVVRLVRRLAREKTVGHAGTLDPFATGVLVVLIGRKYTAKSNEFLFADKTYRAVAHLGVETDSYDRDGKIVSESSLFPSLASVEEAVARFQGKILQTPPMYSAKKIGGKKLYELARQGIEVARQPVLVELDIEILSYTYPLLELNVRCSKGTYIRSLAYDLGKMLGCGAHLSSLARLASGQFLLQDCLPQSRLLEPEFPLQDYLRSGA